MADSLLTLLEEVVRSGWVYPLLFALAAVDAFFPVVPSETSVITAGVFAATGEPSLPLVILVAGLGAFAGDNFSYAVGRLAGPRIDARAKRGSRRRRALDHARNVLDSRGGVIIVVARYFPGARTAVTFSAGAVAYPLRRFVGFAALAAVTWAVYASLVGYVGGIAFEQDPLKGLLLGFAVAAIVALCAEIGRALFRRRLQRVEMAR